jgi:hypothetical protein
MATTTPIAGNYTDNRSHHRSPDLRIINCHIAFRGGNALVSEQHLHCAQVPGTAVGAAGEACRSESSSRFARE